MKPVIGITARPDTNSFGHELTTITDAYSGAILEAGGLPVLIPPVLAPEAARLLFARLDGVLLSGGGDVAPALYGSDHHGRLVDVHPQRDALELELARLSVSQAKPFLGICRGCQVLNVALGGTLFPDLPMDPGGTIQHDRPGSDRRVTAHEVALEGDTHLAAMVGQDRIGVNSHHHQGLRDVAPGLRVTARAPDGLVEAVEVADHPFAVAVQWHPEWLTDQRWAHDLFGAFVAAAAASFSR